MQRNRGVDIYRTAALLLVLIYHAWVVCGQPGISIPVISTLVSLGGEIGVTAFFLLSGFGIYNSLQSMEEKGCLTFKNHIWKRFYRVAPQYYLNLLVMVLFGGAAYCLSSVGWMDLMSHVLFAHNFSLNYHGSINGVLWTMAIIFQFYLVAILLYKLMKKNAFLFWVGSLILTIGIKFVIFRWVGIVYGGNVTWNFYLGRQLPSALDNFTTGMFVAYLLEATRTREKKLWISWSIVLFGMLCMLQICDYGLARGIHTTGVSGYLWHSLLAIALGIVMFGISMIPFSTDNWFIKPLLWISKMEYGIYLWHLVMFRNVIGGSGWIQELVLSGHVVLVMILLVGISIPIGALFTKMTDAFMKECMVRRSQRG